MLAHPPDVHFQVTVISHPLVQKIRQATIPKHYLPEWAHIAHADALDADSSAFDSIILAFRLLHPLRLIDLHRHRLDDPLDRFDPRRVEGQVLELRSTTP
jgi:hypothetical protein